MNAQIAAQEIRKNLRGIAELYNRLLLVVDPTGSGKTAALRAFAAEENSSIVNIGGPSSVGPDGKAKDH